MSRFDKAGVPDTIAAHAEVAELADALRSGRSERKLIWVQLPASALVEGSEEG